VISAIYAPLKEDREYGFFRITEQGIEAAEENF
jgi:hypothetical protein